MNVCRKSWNQNSFWSVKISKVHLSMMRAFRRHRTRAKACSSWNHSIKNAQGKESKYWPTFEQNVSTHKNLRFLLTYVAKKSMSGLSPSWKISKEDFKPNLPLNDRGGRGKCRFLTFILRQAAGNTRKRGLLFNSLHATSQLGCPSLLVCMTIWRADSKFSTHLSKASSKPPASLRSACLELGCTPHAMRNIFRINIFGGKRASHNKHLSSPVSAGQHLTSDGIDVNKVGKHDPQGLLKKSMR